MCMHMTSERTCDIEHLPSDFAGRADAGDLLGRVHPASHDDKQASKMNTGHSPTLKSAAEHEYIDPITRRLIGPT
jgi:hypothetical protein